MLAAVLIAATVTVKVPPAVVRPVGCDPSRFVTKAYQDLLGRPIDPAGRTYWLGVLKNGASRIQVATQLMNSAEYRNAVVRDLYNSYLHRSPNGSEVAAFSHMTTEQAASAILGSAEYFSQRGLGTNAGFVAALYQDVLGRSPDPQATTLFMQQIGAGTSRAVIAQQVLGSFEARQRWINAVYAKYLHRAAAGAVPPGGRDQVVAFIIASDEYCRQ
ncbi:MAG TPA: DUF4214 domain-containing protein [Thermoanaerobaculia bacterium]|nr:DUF4214 domain-containing protein [Thermoanaerobaculia bacterium]